MKKTLPLIWLLIVCFAVGIAIAQDPPPRSPPPAPNNKPHPRK